MSDLKISICMPVYNPSVFIKDTLKCILNQSFRDFELIIVDDASTLNVQEIIKDFKDSRIKYFRNEKNIGYSKNLEICRTKCSNEIIFLMSQDDIVADNTLYRIYEIFKKSENIGAITRPYYFFHNNDVKRAVRVRGVYNKKCDSIVSIGSGLKSIVKIFETLDQFSGLAYRRKYMDRGFHKDIFTSHIYPFASIFKKYDVVLLKDYTIAARIATSQTRSLSTIYSKSPLQSWVDMFNSVFYEPEFTRMRRYCIKNFVAKNFVGLVQIKNYGQFRWLIREITLLIKYRWQNIFDIRFWFFALGTLIVPRRFLIWLADNYKDKVLSKFLKNIKLAE